MVSDNQHTPGPWRVAKYSDAERHIVARVDGKATSIAGFCLPNDADLIAAAPELLDALKALQLQGLQSELNDPAHEYGYAALEMARAAIAKAQGL